MRELPASTDRKRLIGNMNFYLDRLAFEALGGEPSWSQRPVGQDRSGAGHDASR